jgi:membrane fusion protein (multidrug efflux system)
MALPKKTRIAATLLLLAVATGSVLYFDSHASEASIQSTAEAYIQADFTTVAPQVSGVVHSVLVEDNQVVKQGELLAMLDERDFIIAVDAAKAQVASAQASIAGLEARIAQQQSAIDQAQAAVAADEAALELAEVNEQRYRNLAADGSGTVQALQQAAAQLEIQAATLQKNQAGLQLARQQLVIFAADLDKARAVLAQTQAAQAAAELQLSYTRITAPIAGTIGQKALRVGAFVNTGKPLLALVPLDAVYISANFRETQLARIQPGQRVDIEVDALPGVMLRGRVQSIGPASGVSYSALAPHNATGNFTKIVQRLPVRIQLDGGQPAAASLRVGMSVTPKIHIDD